MHQQEQFRFGMMSRFGNQKISDPAKSISLFICYKFLVLHFFCDQRRQRIRNAAFAAKEALKHDRNSALRAST